MCSRAKPGREFCSFFAYSKGGKFGNNRRLLRLVSVSSANQDGGRDSRSSSVELHGIDRTRPTGRGNAETTTKSAQRKSVQNKGKAGRQAPESAN